MDGFRILNGMERALIQVVPPFVQEVVHLCIFRVRACMYGENERQCDGGRTQQKRGEWSCRQYGKGEHRRELVS